MTTLLSVLLAFVLDVIVGDPQILPHPVVGIGRATEKLESVLRRLFPETKRGEFLGGCVLAGLVVCTSGALAFALCALAGFIHPALRFICETWLCYQAFALGELRKQSMAVLHALTSGTLSSAQKALGRIVGRDTECLDADGVVRAAVESVAESTCDGVVAPLMYAMIGGAPLVWAYKAINTLDSMVGYNNERYCFFGRASARLDDVANWVPARFTAGCMMIAARIGGFSGGGAYRMWLRDRKKSASPNAAHSESCMAGALGIQLGGSAYYSGVLVEKPLLGDDVRSVEALDIARANSVSRYTSIIALGVLSFIRFAIYCAGVL